MDFVITKVFNPDESKTESLKEHHLIGYSKLSGGGNFLITSFLDNEAIERAKEKEYLCYTFKIFDENHDVIVEGISDHSDLEAALVVAHDHFLQEYVIEYIEVYFEDSTLENTIHVDDIEEFEEDIT